MTLVTGTVQDLGYDGMEGTLWARPARFRSDGQVVYAPERKPYKVVDGAVSADLAPGPAVLELQVGSHARGTFEVVIPEEDTSLADLLDTVFPWEPAQISLFVAEREAAELAKAEAEAAAGQAAAAANQTGQDRTHVDQVAALLDDAYDQSQAGMALPPRLMESALNATYATPDALVVDLGRYCAADGVTDDLAAIQAQIDLASTNGGVLRFTGQNKVYAVSGTIHIKRRVTVELPSGVIVRRVGAGTDPVFRIGGNEANLTGSGRVETPNASPNGLILFGPPDLTTLNNVLNCELGSLTLSGVNAPGSIGIKFWSSFVAAGGATYNNRCVGTNLTGFGTAVLVSDVSNANEFHGLQIKDVSETAFDFHANTVDHRGADENAVIGGFVRNASGATIVRIRNAVYNQIIGLRAEPQGAGSKPYDLDATSKHNHLMIINNSTQAGVDVGEQNIIIENGDVKGFRRVHAGSGNLSEMSFGFMTEKNTGMYLRAPGVLGLATGGTERIRMGTNVAMQTNLQFGANYAEFLAASPPATPNSGFIRVFARNNGGAIELCQIDSAGTVKPLV